MLAPYSNELSMSSSNHCSCLWPHARLVTLSRTLGSAREVQGFARVHSARLEMLVALTVIHEFGQFEAPMTGIASRTPKLLQLGHVVRSSDSSLGPCRNWR